MVRLAWLIRRRGISIIHTSDRPRDAFAAVVLGRLTGARSLVHVHVGYDATWMGRLLRWSLAHADGLVAVSAFVARTLMDAGIDPARVHVVLNGIEPAAWHPDAGADATRAELGLSDESQVLLTVCRLFPGKGAGDVIEALGPLHEELPDVYLLIVGTDVTPGGRYSAELHRRVAELGLTDHVRFLGRRADIEGIMAAADVYVMPSHLEPFGLVFCEAMAMARPVVATGNGGTVEVVEHGRTGLLSPPGDVDALVANLKRVLCDPTERAAMGAAGRRAVLERFTAERMAHDVACVYQHYPRRVEGWWTHMRLRSGARESGDGGHGRVGEPERGLVPRGDGDRRLHRHPRRRVAGSPDAGRQRADR
jgi:glycosyltransferase involved in cell wall biosynthesis